MSPDPGRTALYRIRGEVGLLLYIGISNSVPIRWNHHVQFQPWWDELRSLTVDWYDKRTDAEAAEKAAIKAERPKYNKAHAVKPPMRAAEPPRPPSVFAEIDNWQSDDGLITVYDLATCVGIKPGELERLTRNGEAPMSISGEGRTRKYRPVDVKLWFAGNTRRTAKDPASGNPVTGPCYAAEILAPAVAALGFSEAAFDPSTPEGRDAIWGAYLACRDFMSKQLATAA